MSKSLDDLIKEYNELQESTVGTEIKAYDSCGDDDNPSGECCCYGHGGLSYADEKAPV